MQTETCMMTVTDVRNTLTSTLNAGSMQTAKREQITRGPNVQDERSAAGAVSTDAVTRVLFPHEAK